MSTKRNSTKIPLTEKAYQRLYQEIVVGSLAPGAHLDEGGLVKRLNIGRTPIREALLRLSSEHLIENVPNKGFAVQPITLQNTRAIFQALLLLEDAVVDLAMSHDLTDHLADMEAVNQQIAEAITADDPWELVRLNNGFHIQFAACSDNEYMVGALRNVRFGSARLAYLSFSHELEQENKLDAHYKSVVHEHQAIIKCLAEKDKEELKRINKEHLRTFQRRIVSYLTTLSL